MSEYKCEECHEFLEHKVNCARHSIETKHENYWLIGTDVKVNIKCPTMN